MKAGAIVYRGRFPKLARWWFLGTGVLRLIPEMLKPPRSITMVVRRRPIKIGPSGELPPREALNWEELAQPVRKLLLRKQILYWSTVSASLGLALIALWVILGRR
jgi:hypothetical protein